MKRVFADLHLKPNPKDTDQVKKLIAKAAQLGYRYSAVALPPETNAETIRNLKIVAAEVKVDFVSRVDLHPRNQNDLLSMLRKLRRRFEIVSVQCDNKEIARQAAKDRRVDLLSFPSTDYRYRFFDRAEAELASSGAAGFEVDVKPLLVLEGPPRVRFLSTLRRELAVALEFHLPIVLSSGASETVLLRKPRETAMLASLFGLTGSAALDAVSTSPAHMVKVNREKLGANFVAPGIRLIKKGADC